MPTPSGALGMVKGERNLMARVTFNPYTEQALVQQADAFRKGRMDELQSDVRDWRWMPPGTNPILPCIHWHVAMGGIEFAMYLPKLDGSGTREPVRALAQFAYPGDAKAALELQRTMRTAALYLLRSDDTGDPRVTPEWYARMRFYPKGFKVGQKDKRWQRRRWLTAPEGWPRDKYGRPLSAATIARRGIASVPGGTQ